MRVAILGTGKMGAAMAKRLAGQGHQLTMWNRTRSRAESLGLGEVVDTPAEAAAAADAVISMLTNADAVRAAYLGDEGAVRSAHGKLFIDMSTGGVEIGKEIAATLEQAGGEFVEAPVVGSVGAIEAGSAVILVGGAPAAAERARPVLLAFGDVRYIGAMGSAATLKLVANSMLAGVYSLAAELLGAGAAAGLPAEETFFFLNRVAPLLTQRKTGFIEHRYEPVTFAIRDLDKDLDLATDLFHGLGAATPMTDRTRELFDQVAATKPGLEVSAIASLYEREGAANQS